MTNLTERERELVSLGAAMGSNCVPCMEYHIPAARKAGLSDPQIAEAVQLADRVRKVPAQKVLDVSLSILGKAPSETAAGEPVGPCAQAAGPACCG